MCYPEASPEQWLGVRLPASALLLLCLLAVPPQAAAQRDGTAWVNGFENGLGDWYADNGTWEAGAPTSGPNGCYTGSRCVATVLAGNYRDNIDSRLISPPFVVPSAADNPRLRFWHWFDFNNGDDGQVQISTNGGDNWEVIHTVVEGDRGSDIWSRPSVDLSDYAGQRVQIAFDLHTRDACFGSCTDTDKGWYIDEVMITGRIAVNADVVVFDLTPEAETTTRTLVVTNPGSIDLNVFELSVSGPDAEQFEADTTPFVLAPSASWPIALGFRPTRVDSFAATLTLVSTAGTTRVDLTGETAVAALAVAEERLDFGLVPVGEEGTRAATVSNTGTSDLEVLAPTLHGADADLSVTAGFTFTIH